MIQGKNDIFQITCSFLEAFKRHVIDERQRYEKRRSESRRRRQRRNGAKERGSVSSDSNIKNEHVPAGHTTNRSRGMKVLDTETRYTGGNSRRTGADTVAKRGWDSRCPMDLLLSSLLLLTAGNDNGKSCLLYSGAHDGRKIDRAKESESRLNNTDTWWFTMNLRGTVARKRETERGIRDFCLPAQCAALITHSSRARLVSSHS